jgi:hypothetical protein
LRVARSEGPRRNAANLDSKSRFLLEAVITGGLEHPGIVPIYSLGQYENGRPFYAMRLIRGDNLQESITRFHEKNKQGGSADFVRVPAGFIARCDTRFRTD